MDSTTPRGRRGRPSKLTAEVQAAILASVADGVPRKWAARSAGVGERTVREWIERGHRGEKRYSAFAAALTKKEADAVARMVLFIQKAGPKTWQAAAWWLERRYPEEFGTNRRELAELRKEVAALKQLLDKLEARAPRAESTP